THDVAGDDRRTLRRQLLAVEAVGYDADAVARPRGIDEEEITRRVRARVADLVVLRDDVSDHRVTGVALPDVEPRIGTARRVRVIELPPLGVVGVDPVVAVAVRGEVRPSVPQYAVPEEAVPGEIARGEVLDRDTVSAHHEHAVLTLELTVEDGAVAI